MLFKLILIHCIKLAQKILACHRDLKTSNIHNNKSNILKIYQHDDRHYISIKI